MTVVTTTTENQLFNWDGWDQQDTAAFTFYNVEMKVPAGKYQVGQKFSAVLVDYERSKLSVWEEGNDTGTPDAQFDLVLSIA